MDSPSIPRQSAEPRYSTEESGGVYMLGVNLSTKSKWFQLSYCTAGVFFGFMINGVCEEYVFKGINFNFAWYVTLIQSLIYLLLAHLHGFRPHHRRQKWSAYVWLASVLVGSMGLTKASLLYLNYPAQIMFKSSKVLPVMLLGSFMPGFHRRYSRHEYTSALLLVGGLVVFTLSDASATPSFHPAGVVMIVAALVCDAFLGNLQEAIFSKDPETSQIEVLFCSTLAGLAFLLPPLLLTGELWMAWKRGLEVPMTYVLLALTAGTTYVGQLAILSLINLFGAATTYVITSLRKAFTLALSYLIFVKPLSRGHLFGFLLIAISLSMKAFPPEAHLYAKVSNSPIPGNPGSGNDTKEVGKGGKVIERLPKYEHMSIFWRGGGVATAGTNERMGGGEGEGVRDDVADVGDLAKKFSGLTNGEAKHSLITRINPDGIVHTDRSSNGVQLDGSNIFVATPIQVTCGVEV